VGVDLPDCGSGEVIPNSDSGTVSFSLSDPSRGVADGALEDDDVLREVDFRGVRFLTPGLRDKLDPVVEGDTEGNKTRLLLGVDGVCDVFDLLSDISPSFAPPRSDADRLPRRDNVEVITFGPVSDENVLEVLDGGVVSEPRPGAGRRRTGLCGNE
jgi:hypothetical protein